jgi:hypothetical protein
VKHPDPEVLENLWYRDLATGVTDSRLEEALSGGGRQRQAGVSKRSTSVSRIHVA